MDNPLIDAVVLRGRATLLVGLASCLWLWCEREHAAWPESDLKQSVSAFLQRNANLIELWGEGAVPQLLAYFWYLQQSDATPRGDMGLASLCSALCAHASDANTAALPSPYYGYEDAMRAKLAGAFAWESPLADDTARGTSFFAESAFHLVVRTGLKQRAKELWPALTHVANRSFDHAETWHFCTWRREGDGREATRFPPLSETWENVVLQARSIATPELPDALRRRPILLMLFALVCPHRATPNVVRFLGYIFGTFWFPAGPIQ